LTHHHLLIPNNPSPQAQLEDATGFDKQTAIDVAAMIGNSNFYPEALRRFATDYIASVRQGGSVGKKGEGGLGSLIRVMNRLADSDPDNYPRANPQNQLAIQAAGGGGPTIMTRAAMQREQGRADNQAFNKELQAAVNADTTMDRQTKALVLEGLNKALKTFAGNPVEAVEAIYLDVATRAKNPQYADQYIMPYVERVTAQQQQQAATEQPAATEAPSGEPEINRMSTLDIFANPPVLEGTGKKGIVTIEDVGRYLESKSIEAGSRSPRTIRGAKETNSIDYTPDVKQRLFDDILEESKEFYRTNPGAAYWYTFGSPEALDMMSKSIPELQEDGTNHPDRGLPLQMLFWTLISPLSGGQDPVANAKLAVDVLRYYIQNGTIPLSKYKGGLFINDDNVAAKEAEGEILAWTARGKTTSNALAAIQNGIDTFGSLEQFMLWMVTPHPQQEVVDQYQQLGFGSEEASKSLPKYADENGMLYGSQVLGPKFGPFLLNNTGNESKVTKDEWFTRSWNRLNGRMFTANGKEMLSQPSSPEERMVQDEIITRVAAEIGLEPSPGTSVMVGL
jgi:hypothetical protein